MAINKFYSGFTHYHQENLTYLFGHHVGASTISINGIQQQSGSTIFMNFNAKRLPHLFWSMTRVIGILTQEPW